MRPLVHKRKGIAMDFRIPKCIKDLGLLGCMPPVRTLQRITEFSVSAMRFLIQTPSRRMLYIPLLQGRLRRAPGRPRVPRLPAVQPPRAANRQPQLRQLHGVPQGALDRANQGRSAAFVCDMCRLRVRYHRAASR